MPHPRPYFAGETMADFQQGVNFAYGRSTALGPEFFESKGFTLFMPVSLANQTDWFRNVLQLAGSVEGKSTYIYIVILVLDLVKSQVD